MAKVKMTLNQLSDVDVQFISLVSRAASRLPFKAMKSDDINEEGDMKNKSFAGLDLTTIFRRKSDAPTVVGVVTRKGESLDAVKAKIEEAGFTVGDVIDNDDGTLLYKQDHDDTALGSPVVVRMSDDVALVMKGFSSYSLSVDTGSSFAEVCAAQGFYPGVYAFSETLTDSIRTAVYDADTPSAASAAVGKILDEAKAYIQSLVAHLPEKAFKMDSLIAAEAVAKAEQPAPVAEVTTTAEGDQATQLEVKAEGDEVVVEVEGELEVKADTIEVVEVKAEGDVVVEVKADEPVTAEVDAAKAVKADESAAIATAIATALAPLMTGLSESIAQVALKQEQSISALSKSLTDGLTTITESVNVVVTKADEAVTTATTSAEQALKSVVVGQVVDTDPPATVVVQKQDVLSGDFDTAFLGRRQPKTRR